MRDCTHSILRSLAGLAVVLSVVGISTGAYAQHESSVAPYASIGSKGVCYAGPGRESSFDLPGKTIRIGILAPTHGPEKAEGTAILTAAKMALHDASRQPLPGGLRLTLSIADESVPPWGILGDEIIHLVVQKKVVAIVTAADGVAAHLSEQIGNKIGVATLTLSGDDTTTEINMPWIFRMGPSDSQQAQVMARNIYRVREFRRVLLVSGNDHDGRIASREFIKQVRKFGAPTPLVLHINPLQPDAGSLPATIRTKSPQAVVFWTSPENTMKLILEMKSAGVRIPIYLSQQAAQTGSGLKFRVLHTAGVNGPPGPGIYSVASKQDNAPSDQSFVRRYLLATGSFPSPVAAEAYDAVRLIAQAVREAGPNRARVRDRVSSTQNFAGVSGMVSFDNQGNNRTSVGLIRLQ